jgi:hypothetical protein
MAGGGCIKAEPATGAAVARMLDCKKTLRLIRDPEGFLSPLFFIADLSGVLC